jgi:GNAT superfamily N-acetyltransferase
MWLASAKAGFAPLLPDGHPFPEPDPDRMRAGLLNPNVSLLVADRGEGVVGYTGCGASRDPDAGPEVGEIWSFFVAADGWRRGTGRALMAAALADLAGRGYTEVTVWSFGANARANAFYEAHGFGRDGTTRTEEAWAHILEVRYRRSLP